MSEPSIAYWNGLAAVFLPAYNELYGENFAWVDERLAGEPSDREFKNDSGNILEVQLVEAVGTKGDVLRQKIRPKTTEKIIFTLQKELIDRGIKNIRCVINFHNPPEDADDQKKLIYWLAHAIMRLQTKRLTHTYYIDYDANDIEDYIDPIKKWVSEFAVYPARVARPEFTFSSTEHPLNPLGVLDCAQRFENAVNLKVGVNYDREAAKKLVLLVDFVDFPWSDREIEEIKERAAAIQAPFKSVWIIQRWSPARAIEVYRSTTV